MPTGIIQERTNKLYLSVEFVNTGEPQKQGRMDTTAKELFW